MSDEEDQIEEKPFAVEYAKQGRAVCKKCKQKCLRGELRIAKLIYNPFGSGKMKSWHHVNCLFELFLKQRATTKRLEDTDEIEGWDLLNDDDKNDILNRIKECDKFFSNKTTNKSPKKQNTSEANTKSPKGGKNSEKKATPNTGKDSGSNSKLNKPSKDNYFKEFRRLVADITNVSSYLDKTSCVKKLFKDGVDGSGFKDDVVLWSRLLLPGVVKRVYNLQSKQLIKLFSRILSADQNDMLEDLEQGDIGETIQKFFEESLTTKPTTKSTLTVKEVDVFLETLSKLTKEDDQIDHFKKLVPKCTSNDLKIVIRLIKGDLRMGAGAKHVLEGIHPDAYEAYQASRDLEAVILKCLNEDGNGKKTGKNVKADISLMTPILPMLAEACKSVEQALKKCPNGMYSEIKYDGERVQVHKHGTEFKYFSRSLKPVLSHKIQHFKEYIPKAFPHAKDLILDSEILMMDTNTGKPLPFGTLGKHKKEEFKDANVCLFVFDCIYYNGESLVKKPIKHRKKVLQENMKEIPNRIVFSEMEEINKPEELTKMIAKVLHLGLEGLVLKDIESIYEPGKRHWQKVKKDYLLDGAMADTADLIVLGAWYGTGKKGGKMSIFLMGCYNPKNKKFCTVTKVHTGHDDNTLEKLQDQLKMTKISQDMSKIPNWLTCTKTMVPDLVAKDPKKQPVWEITGAEFTQHDVHTANGISIRFPRVTRIREDKNWQTATNLQELQKLYEKSKEKTDVSLLLKRMDSEGNKNKDDEGPSPKKTKKDDSPEKKIQNKNKPKKKVKKVDEAMEQDNNEQNGEADEEQESITKTSTASMEINEPIPDYFQGLKAIFEDELKDANHSEVIRYFIAHGGIILNANEWKEATHMFHYYNIVSEPVKNCPNNSRHLAFEWIKDTVANGSVQDFRNYTIKWDPDV